MIALTGNAELHHMGRRPGIDAGELFPRLHASQLLIQNLTSHCLPSLQDPVNRGIVHEQSLTNRVIHDEYIIPRESSKSRCNEGEGELWPWVGGH